MVPFTIMQHAVSGNMVFLTPTFRVEYTVITYALDALYKKVMILHKFKHFPFFLIVSIKY